MPTENSNCFFDFLKNNSDLSSLFEKIEQDLGLGKLEKKDYEKLLANLRKLGFSIDTKYTIRKKSPQEIATQDQDNDTFHKTLISAFSVKKGLTENEKIKQEKLMTLRRILASWDQPNLKRGGKDRNRIKHKRDLDKTNRRHVLIGLALITYVLIENHEKFSTLNNQKNLTLDKPLELIELISEQMTLLVSEAIQEEKEIQKIGNAILSFKTPTKTKKFVKYLGILIAFVGSLACGLSTGGAIFLLFPSLPILGLSIGVLITLFGFSANFGFFSHNFPDFLLSFLKKGAITRYGKLPALKKYIFIPMAVIASITVGLGSTAITYSTILALATQLLPMLALIWPPLPVVIVGSLSLAVGLMLTVAVLTATVKGIKNSSPSFSWNNVKQRIGELSKLQIVAYLFKGVLMIVGLFGLVYFRYAAGLDLIPFIGTIGSIIISVIAFIPQAVFTVFSIDKLFTVFSQLSHPNAAATERISESRFERFKSISYSIYSMVCLVGNAIGNAALVVVDSISPWSIRITAAIANFINSWAANTPEPRNNNPNDLEQNKKLANLLSFQANSPTDSSTTTNEYLLLCDSSLLPSDNSNSHNVGISVNHQSTPTTPVDNKSYLSQITTSNACFFSSSNETRKACASNAQSRIPR